MANGGAHSDPVEDITDTASVDEQTEEFWETEAATVGGDEMGGATPSENEEDPSRTTQQPRRQQNGIAQNSPDQQHNNDRFFQPSTIAAIYVFLNIAAILSGWSFYASNVPQPSVIGALKSPLMLSIVGIVFFVSATHFVFRRM